MNNKFHVFLKNGTKVVYAERFIITPSGVLLFKDALDENVEAFANFESVEMAAE